MTTKRSEMLFLLLAIPIDLLMVFLAFLTAYFLRAQTDLIYLWPFPTYAGFMALLLPGWLAVFALSGLYNRQVRSRRWSEFTRIFMAVSTGFMFFVIWIFLSRTLFFSRLIVIYAWALAIFYVTFGRYLLGTLQRSLFRHGYGLRNVIIVGETETAQQLKYELENNKDNGYKVLNGLIAPKFETIKQFVIAHPQLDEMIVADSDLSNNETLSLIALAEEHNLSFRLVPNLFEVKSTNIDVQTLAAIPIIEYRRTPLEGWAGVVKRIFDIVLGSIALLLLSPIFVIISLLVKLDSPGPVYYRHKRLGYGKKEFFLYKFRTMKIEYCTGEGYTGKTPQEILAENFKDPKLAKEFEKEQKLKDDPRVTGLGKFLRKTSLDELPQFFNVVLGQLSLVGPRPIVQAELDKYGSNKHRLFIVKPGLTGLWQVSGRSDMPYKERVKLDMYYIENWSIWSDLIIMVKTALVILLRKNAY
jgi:exopolysaccharide biosynthesis polyprenyl glycosylphosphotransferase